MKTVIHLSSDEDNAFDGALSNIENLLTDETIDVEAVALIVNSTGVKRLTSNSRYADRLRKCLDHGADIKACSNSLEANRMGEQQLMDGIEVVSGAVSELTRLQHDGYAYIRP